MCISRTSPVAHTPRLAEGASFVSRLAIAALLMTGASMAQTVIINQQGTTNPATNGFALNGGSSVTSGGPSGNGWNVQGAWCCAAEVYDLTTNQVTQLNTATNWAFIVTYQNLSPDTGPGYFGWACGEGSFAIIQVNGVRFDLDLHSDGHGNQVLCLDEISGSPNYTITGLGTNPVTLELLYNNSTNTANVFVNGAQVISNYAGHSPVAGYTANLVEFGGENGTFSQVLLETNVTLPPPTPQILSQLAFGGGWYTALYFTNVSNASVQFTVDFIGNSGNPLVIPAVGGSSVVVNLAARSTAVIQAPNVGSLVQGYVSVALPFGVTGYGVFRQSVPGQQDQEAVVPLSGTTTSTSTLLFDDTNYITGVAVVNLASVSTAISVTAYGNQGNVIGTSSIPLAANAKTAVVLRNLPGLAGLAGTFGSVDFSAPIGNLAVLGLRFNGLAFTSIPASSP